MGELMIEKKDLDTIMNTISELKQEQITAAYALNMCMISISQIIQYRDVQIMEQEYEAILNNINLENISKDEALLDVLKQILNTITFFRIQDGDKKLLEKEYKKKMKNAIWSAIPSPTMIAGGSIGSLVASLAVVVGTGYMNYRKAKADIDSEHEKNAWQLEKAAIEQFNGLRRELFNASWKFAEHYEYPDALRLTENQINKYNQILIDDNPIRKYERLWSVKDNYYAYPSFWYYLGNAAHEIYTLSSDELKKSCDDGKYSAISFKKLGKELSESEREVYKEKAKECFAIFWEINKKPLLREDQIACQCALEYADLLDDEEQRIYYLDEARKYGADLCDVLQLCAIGYIKNGATFKAIEVLNILVNEDYNTEVNMQLLSGQYIFAYNKCNEEKIKNEIHSEYCMLEYRAPKYKYSIMKWSPEREIQDDFLKNQKSNIKKRYDIMISEVEEYFIISLNKLFPALDRSKSHSEEYFSRGMINKRLRDMNAILGLERDAYYDKLYGKKIAFEFLDACNDIYRIVSKLNEVSAGVAAFKTKLEEFIKSKKDELLDIQNKCMQERFTFTDFKKYIELISAAELPEAFGLLKDAAKEKLEKIERMDQINTIESDLYSLCDEYNLKYPIVSSDEKNEEEASNQEIEVVFEIGLLGESAKEEYTHLDKTTRMINVIKECGEAVIKKECKSKWLNQRGDGFEEYYEKEKLELYVGKDEIIAILDDRSWKNYDLIFTTNGVICSIGKEHYGDILYSGVSLSEDKKLIKFKQMDNVHNKVNVPDYKGDNLDLEKMMELIRRLGEITMEGGK